MRWRLQQRNSRGQCVTVSPTRTTYQPSKYRHHASMYECSRATYPSHTTVASRSHLVSLLTFEPFCLLAHRAFQFFPFPSFLLSLCSKDALLFFATPVRARISSSSNALSLHIHLIQYVAHQRREHITASAVILRSSNMSCLIRSDFDRMLMYLSRNTSVSSSCFSTRFCRRTTDTN